MTMAIKGMDRLLRKLESSGGNTQQALKIGIQKATKKIQADAKRLAPAGTSGQLRNSIQATVEERDGTVVGTVSTNLEYAPYIEFGTGPIGDQAPKDLPAEVANQLSYRQDGWWVHESQIGDATLQHYNFLLEINTKQGKFYYSEGQKPQPFLYPAAAQNKDVVLKMVASAINDEIKKLGEQ